MATKEADAMAAASNNTGEKRKRVVNMEQAQKAPDPPPAPVQEMVDEVNEAAEEAALAMEAAPLEEDAAPPANVDVTQIKAADKHTQRLLDQASRGVSSDELELEALAGQLSGILGVPMKASNMIERMQRIEPDKLTTEQKAAVQAIMMPFMAKAAAAFQQAGHTEEASYMQETIDEVKASAVAPPVASPKAAPPPARAAAPQAPPPGMPPRFRGLGRFEGPGATVGAPVVPPAAMRPDPVAEWNRRRARPPGMFVDVEQGRRVNLDIAFQGTFQDRDDTLVPGQTEVQVIGTLPRDMDPAVLWELRSVQFHPFGLDRLLVAGISVDGVQIAPTGPATAYRTPDGAPTAVLGAHSRVVVKLRNLTTGPLPIALVMRAFEFVPED